MITLLLPMTMKVFLADFNIDIERQPAGYLFQITDVAL